MFVKFRVVAAMVLGTGTLTREQKSRSAPVALALLDCAPQIRKGASRCDHVTFKNTPATGAQSQPSQALLLPFPTYHLLLTNHVERSPYKAASFESTPGSQAERVTMLHFPGAFGKLVLRCLHEAIGRGETSSPHQTSANFELPAS